MKRLYLFALSLVWICSAVKAQSPEHEKFKSLEPYDFHLTWLRADSAILIDVREPFEFRGKRIRDAVNLPSTDNLEMASDTINKNYSLFFYCTTDYRSKRVAEYFGERGFKKVYNLEGGLVAWKKDHFPVTRKK